MAVVVLLIAAAALVGTHRLGHSVVGWLPGLGPRRIARSAIRRTTGLRAGVPARSITGVTSPESPSAGVNLLDARVGRLNAVERRRWAVERGEPEHRE
jgi:hypothetical protein